MMTGRRHGTVAALLMASLLAGCTSSASPEPPTRSLNAAPPAASGPPPCTGSAGENPLRGFFADLGAGKPVAQILDAYVVRQEDFARWWDGTLEPGHEIRGGWALPAESRERLRQHLTDLQREGMRLVVDEFTDVGFQGIGIDEGGWFNFRVRGHFEDGDSGRGGGGKGAVDCPTGRLKAIVLG